ncbi:hypothetical protein D9M71_730670 [compost metagenome]
MVSDTTLIFIPRNGSAALMNHCNSANCCSGVRVEGLNSLPIHFFAASSYWSAQAVPCTLASTSNAARVKCRLLCLLSNIVISRFSYPTGPLAQPQRNTTASHASDSSEATHNGQSLTPTTSRCR